MNVADRNRVTALAEAQGSEGLLTADEAARIAIVCAQLPLETETFAAEAAQAGTLAIPLVHHLRHSLGDDALAVKIHWGATSQDVVDTALMLQAKAGLVLVARELMEAEVSEQVGAEHGEVGQVGVTDG